MSKIIHGDCLEEMDKLVVDGVQVDFILCDLPFGVTNCDWDSVIPFNNYVRLSTGKGDKTKIAYKDEVLLYLYKIGYNYKDALQYFNNNSQEGLWQKINKIIKPNGAVALFSSEPFSTNLRNSNMKDYKYDWIWEKNTGTNFFHAKRMPIRYSENISIFYKKQCTYNPQKTTGHVPTNSGIGNNTGNVYGGKSVVNYKGGDTTRFPKNILKFNKVSNYEILVPTQKPVKLLEYFIKTYTDEGEVVLDMTSGSVPKYKEPLDKILIYMVLIFRDRLVPGKIDY